MLKYKVHIQNKGWTEFLQEGRLAGTTGEGLRLEAIIIEGVDEYRVHIQDQGWGPWVKSGEVAGTVGQGLRIEAIEIKGDQINYQVHVQYVGWMDWARDGETAGTTGGGLRIEAIRLLHSVEPIAVDDNRSNFAIAPKPIDVPVPAPAVANSAQTQKSGKIYLAVGHGTQSNGVWDPGCVDGDYTEADLMLAIGKVAAAKLRALGFTVNTDADTDNDKNIAVGVALANEWGADVYTSIHCDYNLAPSGTLPIVYPGSEDGVRLANCFIASAQVRMGLGTRGIIQRDDWEVADTNMTACIFETGGIRPDIGKLLDVEMFGEVVAQGIYDSM
ncbi:MAG: N-acetylmuramoyl-L-alanine amidase [Eubacteriaceae bacterium]|nr:N-acetylmuramoyl-L-alanine amidase [Eubacteriaceae bacterium]